MNDSNKDATDPKNFIFCTLFKEVNNMLSAAGKPKINWDPAVEPSKSLSTTSETLAAPSTAIQGVITCISLEYNDPLAYSVDEEIIAFVDGAAKQNGKVGASAGYAVVIIVESLTEYQIVGKIPAGTTPIPTNNRAELCALRDLFMFVSSSDFNRDHGNAPLNIVYDSAYAMGCVATWYESWTKQPPKEVKANLDIISVAYDHFKRVTAARKIQWLKVSSHKKEPKRYERGVMTTEWYHWYGNSVVDELAQDAS